MKHQQRHLQNLTQLTAELLHFDQDVVIANNKNVPIEQWALHSYYNINITVE